ncbi:ASCH domain-containing protein [Candidatus Bathyarchaeota archaeon A05DMB-2]|nr:ASCH domain-containing protein [Candidatus Bathyarchaeota archaeon A05DMB-2]
MALFKRRHINAIREGRKTQTRRTHRHTWQLGKTYAVRTSYFGKPEGYIRILRKFKQRLGGISAEDVRKEGYNSLEEFKQAWTAINGRWDPDLVVWVYEFRFES